jgi:hypothetical protein
MELHLNTYTLGMMSYTEHFDSYYATDVEYCTSDLEEITAIVKNTRNGKDVIVSAFANQLSYLCRYHRVPRRARLRTPCCWQRRSIVSCWL